MLMRLHILVNPYYQSKKDIMAMENIILVGFGGHARSVADAIENSGKYHIIGYTDFKESYPDFGYQYLGTDERLTEIYTSGTHNAVIALGQIGRNNIRQQLYERLKNIGYALPIIIDPTAILAQHVIIEEGTFIGKGAILNSNVHIGKMCIINTGVLCEHDNVIGDFCHLAVRTVCGGMVTIGNNSFIGANTTIIQGINIGHDAIVGAGSIVLHDILNEEKKYGII